MHQTARLVFVALAVFTLTTNLFAQTPLSTSSISYSVPNRGASSIETTGASGNLVVGYGRVQPASSTTPPGVAIFGLRQNGVLVTEAGVPGVATMLSGRTYAEVSGATNTGVAFANPNTGSVVISFFFTDQFGNDFGQGSFTLNGGAQTAKFLNQAPFNARTNFAGTITFTAAAPVAVIALRTLVNERGDFLVTTQTVVPIPDSFSASPLVMGHFADGGGWRTQVILVNTTDAAISGTVQFFGEGSASAAATPLTLTLNGQVAALFTYTVGARSSLNLQTAGPAGVATQVGSVRVAPTGGTASPSGFTVFSFAKNGVTVTQTTVQAQPAAIAFRTFVEVNSPIASAGSIQSGVAITNNSATPATVNFELTGVDGTSLGVSASLTVPAQGHVSRFVHELFPTLFPATMTDLFRGVLRVSSASSIAVVSLRTRYNERGDFLITTTTASNEASASSIAELFFPHLADGGGYTTQFVLFSGIAGQNATGTLRFFTQEGQPLVLTVR